MKLEKRSSGAPEQPEEAQGGKGSGKKPVVVYIMILFIVAFVLMAISFVMHQRSNSEVIGRLQDSVSALQEVQAAEDKNIQLQQKLTSAEKERDSLRQQLEEANEKTASAQNRADALSSLYALQQQYAARDLDACRATISDMEDKGLDKLLPADEESGVTSPAQRYLQLREAVQSD